MPQYNLMCENNKCDSSIIEVVTSYLQAKSLKCLLCNNTMKIIPTNSNFRVNGYNASNGYHRETINYDGS